MKRVEVTCPAVQSRISFSSSQYATSSNSMFSTGAPVTIMPSNFLSFTSSKFL